MKFKDYKKDIKKALKQSLKANPIAGESNFTMIEGFVSLPVKIDMDDHISCVSRSLPTVALVGETSGRVYTFVLRKLLPDLELDFSVGE